MKAAGRTLLVTCAVVFGCVVWATGALASPGADPAEIELAEKYAPVVRLKIQDDPCPDGEPFRPLDVDRLWDNDEVVLRGPWDRTNVVQIAPSVDELTATRVGYHLDFPGDSLDPGCTYEEWQKRLAAGSEPTTYARVINEEGHPGKLALQYWFFYVFNDFNNTHEGDWEMIQLVFDADSAAQALAQEPVEVGYSQHEGAERAAWGDEKLTIVDGIHPVVYPGAGSQASKFRSALYLGRSAEQGVGCDDTRGPSEEVRPRVATVPQNEEAYLAEFPWLAFGGRWGERQRAFFNGPRGPNLNDRWNKPITWSEEMWLDSSFTVPGGGLFGSDATDFFCAAVAGGSAVLTKALRNWVPVVLTLAGLGILLVFAASRTTWRASTPLRLARRRAWGQIISSSWRMYRNHLGLFVRIGLVFIPVSLFVALIQWLIFEFGLRHFIETTGEKDSLAVTLAFEIGLVFTIFALTIVQAAVAHAMAEIDAGRPASARDSYRHLRGHVWTLLFAVAIAVVIFEVLQLTLIGIPVAIWFIVRWSLLAQAVELEGESGVGVLRRSAALVSGHWFRVASIIIVVGGLTLLIGPLIGVGLLFATTASFNAINVVAGLVYVLAMPFLAIATTYLYYDLRIRKHVEQEAPPEPEMLPAELQT